MMTTKIEQLRRRRRHLLLAAANGFYQNLKITPVKKLVWNEVIFAVSVEERARLSVIITKALIEKGIMESGEKFVIERMSHNLKMVGSHQNTADIIFEALAGISKATGYGFIVNYSSLEDYHDEVEDDEGEHGGGLFLPLSDVNFHPELILNGHRLINDFPDINLNRSCFGIVHGLLVDRTRADQALAEEVKSHREGLEYWSKFSDEELIEKGLVYYDQLEREICSEMLDSLNKYFQVNYVVDVIYGITKQDNLGLCEEIRQKIIARF